MTDNRAEPPLMREAFSLLGHDIRLDILVALLDNWEAAYTDPIPYAELMDAVGVTDSGKFNYHLGKLRGAYVRKVDGGYVPTAAATALYRAVIAHQPDHEMEQTRFDVDSECPCCHAILVGRYERGFLSVDCDSCDDWIGFSYPFPRNGFTNRSNEEAARVAHRRCKRHLAAATAGQCPFCADTTMIDVQEDAITSGSDPAVEITCNSCSFHVGSRILFPLLLDTQVITLLSDAGIDVEQYEWELPEPTTRISSREPLRIRVEVSGEEGTTAIILDDRLNVCSGNSSS
ncbi:winged helix-turn-helix domain-containing protein [Halobacterium yunchengense]|uniref:winged helix-turn-helix domain-containing protein n=1 Tax=Halobacterium yunchengense TaxID=3108497 RepID=UPI00300AEE82